jgi:hypothetical protein
MWLQLQFNTTVFGGIVYYFLMWQVVNCSIYYQQYQYIGSTVRHSSSLVKLVKHSVVVINCMLHGIISSKAHASCFPIDLPTSLKASHSVQLTLSKGIDSKTEGDIDFHVSVRINLATENTCSQAGHRCTRQDVKMIDVLLCNDTISGSILLLLGSKYQFFNPLS